MAVDGVAGAQAEAADLRGRDVDVVGAGQVVRFRRAQEAEAVGQHLDDAFADDVDFLGRELLEDARTSAPACAWSMAFSTSCSSAKASEFGRGFGLEVLEFHFPHAGWSYGDRPAAAEKLQRGRRKEEKKCRRSWVEELWRLRPDAQPAPIHWSRELDCIRLRSVGWRKIGKEVRFRQEAQTFCALATRVDRQNGFSTTRITIRIIRTVGTSLIIR